MAGPIVALIVVVITYLPTWATSYGFSEDYRLLAFYMRGGTNRTLMIAEGRPIQALWTNLVFGSAAGIASLSAIRFCGVLLIGVAAALTAAVWRHADLGRWTASLAAIAVFTLPPIQLASATAAFGVIQPAIVAVVLAVALIIRDTDRESRAVGRRRFAASTLLLVFAFTAYQPVGMMFWAISAIVLFGAPGSRDPGLWKRVIGVGFTAAAIGFCIFLAGRRLYPAELEGMSRGSSTFDAGLKAFWFLLYPLPQALNLWDLQLDRWRALAVALAIFAGLGWRFRREAAVLKSVPAIGFVPLCYLPNLVVAENWSSFRSEMALTPLIAVYAVLALGVLRPISRGRVFGGVLALLAGLGCVTANRNVKNLIAKPQAEELAIVRAHLEKLPSGHRTIGVVMSTENETLAPISLYDEFGRPSTSFTWGVADLPWLVLRELHPDADTADYRVIDVTASPAPVDTVLDWRQILSAARRSN